VVSHDCRQSARRKDCARQRQEERKVPISDHPHDASTPSAATLLARVEAFGFNEPDDPLAFESRLADDNGWTLGHAMAVAAEYRRFLVLTQLAGHAVGPSHDVDQAWHLHLTRSVHYERFCREVLGRFLHHAPSRGGPAEDARHRDLYAATLEAYRRLFDQSPPTTIWPRPGQAAEPPAVAPDWAVPAALRAGQRLGAAAVILALALAWLLLRAGLLQPLQAIPPGLFLLATLAVTLGLAWLGFRRPRVPVEASRRDVLDPYEAAWLAGGARRMATTAAAVLMERGLLRRQDGPADPRAPRPPLAVDRGAPVAGLHPAEGAFMAAATDEGLRLGAGAHNLQGLAASCERRLGAAGLLRDDALLPRRRAHVLAAFVAWLAIAFERIFRALGTPHPVAFLVILTAVDVLLVLALARRARGHAPRAALALARLRRAADAGPGSTRQRVGTALALGVALTGAAAVAGDERFLGLEDPFGGMGPDGARARRKWSGGDGSSCSTWSATSSCGSAGGDGGGSSCASSCGSGCGGGGD